MNRMTHASSLSPKRSRRGQTKLESAIAIILFVIAALGAWALYKEQIKATGKAMVQFFQPSK